MPRPRLWILAGPNGSGKSTLAQEQVHAWLTVTPESDAALLRLNPDDLARALRAADPALSDPDAALRAAQQSDMAIDEAIASGRSAMIETVLSTEKFKARVEAARHRGFEIALTYVLLRSPDLNVARVRQRREMGGHDVPENRIRERWLRSLANLPWFAGNAEAISIWDNSRAADDGPPALLIAATPSSAYVSPACWALLDDPDTHPALRAALQAVIEVI